MMISGTNAELISFFLFSLLLANSLQNVGAEVGLPCSSGGVSNCTTGEECAVNDTCICKNGYTLNETSCLANFGSTCDATNGCSNPYADCTSGNCQCKNGYTRAGNLCKADFGSTCDATNGCSNPYADCTSGNCQCKNGYTRAGNLCKAGNGYQCDATNVCSDMYATCDAISNACKCTTGYTDSNGDGSIVGSLGGVCNANFGSACDATNGCSNSYADCTSGGTCQCRTGYVNVGNFCKAACDATNGCSNSYADCTSGTCQCRTGYVNVGNLCKAKFGSSCDTPNGCIHPFADCLSATCQCRTGYTRVGNVCKAELGYSCNLNNLQVCNDGNATCDTTSGTCLCNKDYYNSSGVCQPLLLLKVKNLIVSSNGEDFLDVRWENPDNVIDVNNFSIIRKRGTEISSPLSVSKNLTATLQHLTAGAAYTIQVNSFYGTTLGATAELQQATKPYKPGPLNLVNSSLDLAVNVLTLVWNYIGESNGADVVYRVELIDSNASGSIVRSFPLLMTRTVSTNTSGLRNGYKYFVNITARSEVFGPGLESRVDSATYTESVKTVPKDPNPPTVVLCSDNTDRSINITWHHPLEPNGDIKQYVVKTYIYRQENVSIITDNTTSPSENFVVTGLEPGQYYRFRVFTQNELTQEQTGGWSQEDYCQTLPNSVGKTSSLSGSSNTDMPAIVGAVCGSLVLISMVVAGTIIIIKKMRMSKLIRGTDNSEDAYMDLTYRTNENPYTDYRVDTVEHI